MTQHKPSREASPLKENRLLKQENRILKRQMAKLLQQMGKAIQQAGGEKPRAKPGCAGCGKSDSTTTFEVPGSQSVLSVCKSCGHRTVVRGKQG